MRVENGKEVYEEGDFDNVFFYAFVGTIIPGGLLALISGDGDMLLLGTLIGAGVYLLRWGIGKLLRRRQK